MSIMYPLVKSRCINGAVCGHFLSPSKTHLVVSHPGEFVVKEVFSSANEYGENQYIPCPSRLCGMYKLPRQEGQVDWLLLAFAVSDPHSERYMNLHVVEFEGESLAERAVFKIEQSSSDFSIKCDARFGQIAVTTGSCDVLHIFSYDNLESPRKTHPEIKHTVIDGLTWISETRLALRTRKAMGGGVMILDLTSKQGKNRMRMKVYTYLELPQNITYAYAGIDNTILRVDQNPRSVVLVFFTENNRLRCKEVEIPLPFTTSDCRLYFFERHSEYSSFLLVGKHNAYKFDLNTTSTSQTISDCDCLRYLNPGFEHQAKSGNDLLSHFSDDNYFVGLVDDSRAIICWTGNLIDLSPSEHFGEAKANVILESPMIPQRIHHLERFSAHEARTCYYLVGETFVHSLIQPDRFEVDGTYYLEVCRIAEKEPFEELGEIPHTESVQRVWTQGSLIVLSTEHESRFLKINMDDYSLVSIDKREWQLDEPTLAVNSHIQVTTSAIYGTAAQIKHQGAYLAAANDSVVVLVRSKESGSTVSLDIYDLSLKESGECEVTFKEAKEFCQPILAVALDERTNRIAICFNTHIDFNEMRYALPGPAHSMVLLNDGFMVGLSDGRAFLLTCDATDKHSLLLNVGETPVVVTRPLEDDTLILSCSSKTIVYRFQSNSFTSPRMARAIARLPGENLVIMAGGRGECVKIGRIVDSDDNRNGFSFTRIVIDASDHCSVVVNHLESTLWHCSSYKTVYNYSIEQCGKHDGAKKIHEIPLGFKEDFYFKVKMIGLSLSQDCEERIDALLIAVEASDRVCSFQAIFPEDGSISEIFSLREEQVPLPDSYDLDDLEKYFELVPLTCLEEGTGRAQFRVIDSMRSGHPIFEVKVSKDGLEATRVVDIDKAGRFFVKNIIDISNAVTPEPLSLRQHGGAGAIILYEEDFAGHEEGKLVYSRREVEIVEEETKKLVHVPLVLCCEQFLIDILEPRITQSKSFGKLTRTFRARMTGECYKIIPAHPSAPGISTGAPSIEKCLDPSAYLVGRSQGDIHVWIELLDDQLLHDLESLELAIRSGIQKSVTFYGPETSQRVIDGKLLRHMFLYCSRYARIELYRHSNISHDRGEAIREAFLSIYG